MDHANSYLDMISVAESGLDKPKAEEIVSSPFGDTSSATGSGESARREPAPPPPPSWNLVQDTDLHLGFEDAWLGYRIHMIPCHVCKILATSVDQYQEHVGGNPHKKKLCALRLKYTQVRDVELARDAASVPGASRGSDIRPRGQQPNRGMSEQSQPAFVDRMRSFMADAEQAGLITRSGQTPEGRRMRTVHVVYEDDVDADRNDAHHTYTRDDLWWNTSLGFEPQ